MCLSRNKLSDVRGELFGFSIITIILFHFCEDVEKADFGGAVNRLFMRRKGA